jgi:hypothetical protein
MGSWAREGEHKDQIEEEGEVEHDKADQNPHLTGAGERQERPRRSSGTAAPWRVRGDSCLRQNGKREG